MGVQGRLTKAEMGVTMPVDAPAYGKKPYHFRKARMLRFDYETDPDKAAQLIPKQLSLTDPATGFLLINEYPFPTRTSLNLAESHLEFGPDGKVY